MGGDKRHVIPPPCQNMGGGYIPPSPPGIYALGCDVIVLSRVPRFQVEDIGDIAMAERIRRLKIKLLMFDQKMCDYSEHLLHIPPNRLPQMLIMVVLVNRRFCRT